MQKGSRANYKLTEYDVQRTKIIGNYRFLLERYPNDTILHMRLQSMMDGVTNLLRLIIKYDEDLRRFKDEVEN